MKIRLLVLMLIGTLSVSAQGNPCGVDSVSTVVPAPDVSVTRELAVLSAEVASLRKKSSKWERLLARLPRISGYVQVGYAWKEELSSDFFIKRVRLDLQGEIVRKFDYRLQVEFASPKIVDVYLRYRPFEELNLQLGEFKLPFSIENTDYPPLKFEFTEYPLCLRKLMGFSDVCGLSATGRDLGAQLYGGFIRRSGYSLVNYNFGVFNGEGINSRDRNKSKDIVVRLAIRPTEGLQVAGSYYWGEYGAEYMRRVRYGVGACYDRGRVVLRGEYICGTTGSMESEGWYAIAGWRATRCLMSAVRYDTFTANCARRSSCQTNYTAGLTWQPVKHLRCQVDYTYEAYAADGERDRNTLAVMLTGIF